MLIDCLLLEDRSFMKLNFKFLPSGSVKLTRLYNDSELNEQQLIDFYSLD
jgi:hypothetical protein